MDKQILNFTVNEQILVCENPIKISTNKVNYIQASFDLGENWDGFDSVRAVWFNDFNCISTVLDSLGNCVVPFEVMKRKGNVKVNLVGSISEDDVLTDRLTSYPVVAVIVDCTAQITGANTSPITPSEFEQFAQRVHTDADRAETAATNAETSAQNASDSATSAHNSAESAHDDKIAIEQAIAEVIQQIEDFEQVQVVVNTLPPSSQATSDFTDGVLTLGIPQGVKGDTGNGIQSIRKTGTSGLVDTYTITFTDGQTTTFTVTNGAKGDTGNGISSIAKTSTVGLVDTYTITYTDGTTTTFTVTNGEKGDKGDTGEVSLSELEDATVVQTLSDSTPYNYRRTNNGNGSGTREYDEIVGASVGWCQLVPPIGTTYWRTASGSANVTFGDNIVAANGNCIITQRSNIPITAGHKYILMFDYHNTIDGSALVRNYLANPTVTITLPTNTSFARYSDLIIPSRSNTIVPTVEDYVSGTLEIKNFMLIDLTLFNSQIADYVYSLEQSTAGSGVTWLKSHFPKLFDNGYQPFDSGSIKSVSGLTAHEMVSANQWDEEWEVGSISATTGEDVTITDRIRSKNYTKVIDATYYFKNGSSLGSAFVFCYDDEKNYLGLASRADDAEVANVSNRRLALRPSTAFIRFYMSNAYGTTYKNDICINLSDPSINGQYFPHESHTYPLDSSVTLRGKYRLDANNNLYADGDVYSSDGTVTRKYAEVDLGTLNWIYNTLVQQFIVSGITWKGSGSNNIAGSIVCAKYLTCPLSGMPDKSIALAGDGDQLRVRDDSYTDATVLKNSLSGVYLVYEKATTTTETATPYESPQWCDSHGTEEYVGSGLPVGHNTQYPMSLADTMPTTNGTFEPRVTVTNGVRTVTWVSV